MAMPIAPNAAAIQTRGAIFSFRNNQLMMATTAGMLAMMTPAETALVMLTPNNMQMENRKLPKKDSRNTSLRIDADMGGSSAGRRSQGNMATAAMPKRNHAKRNTGKAATSGLDKAT